MIKPWYLLLTLLKVHISIIFIEYKNIYCFYDIPSCVAVSQIPNDLSKMRQVKAGNLTSSIEESEKPL